MSIVSLGANTSLGFASPSQTSIVSYVINKEFVSELYQERNQTTFLVFNSKKQNEYTLFSGNTYGNVDLYQKKLQTSFIYFNNKKQNEYTLFSGNTYGTSDIYQEKNQAVILQYKIKSDLRSHILLKYATAFGLSTSVFPTSLSLSGLSSDTTIKQATTGEVTAESRVFPSAVTRFVLVLGQAYVSTKMIPNPGTDFSLYSPFVRFQVKFQRFVEVDIKFFFAVKFVDGRNKLLNTIRYLNFWT